MLTCASWHGRNLSFHPWIDTTPVSETWGREGCCDLTTNCGGCHDLEAYGGSRGSPRLRGGRRLGWGYWASFLIFPFFLIFFFFFFSLYFKIFFLSFFPPVLFLFFYTKNYIPSINFFLPFVHGRKYNFFFLHPSLYSDFFSFICPWGK